MPVAALLLGVLLPLAACRTPAAVTVTPVGPSDGPRVLCIFAHPDDETSVAATLFKTATYLDGVVDMVLITNGEGGFKYSTLAERLYGLELTDESVGRANLPRVRRQEFLAGCKLMGVHRVLFLGQTDHRYTQDPLEVLGPDAQVWDIVGIEEQLVAQLEAGDYDFVLTLAPSATTHGHHQAATVLATRAVAALPLERRPVCLGVRVESAQGGPPARPEAIAGFPGTRVTSQAALVFDRTQPFGHRGRLDYRVLVNWVIAEHKSQGTMQLAMSAGLREHFFLFENGPPDGYGRAAAWLEALAGEQFPARVYGSSAGTNAESPR
jgi:N-acetylglucosamine malate deacetylase 2